MHSIVKVATIASKFSFLKAKYDVRGAGLKVKGDLLGLNFELYREDRLVGRINQKYWAMKERFRLEILEEDSNTELILLGIILALS